VEFRKGFGIAHILIDAYDTVCGLLRNYGACFGRYSIVGNIFRSFIKVER